MGCGGGASPEGGAREGISAPAPSLETQQRSPQFPLQSGVVPAAGEVEEDNAWIWDQRGCPWPAHACCLMSHPPCLCTAPAPAPGPSSARAGVLGGLRSPGGQVRGPASPPSPACRAAPRAGPRDTARGRSAAACSFCSSCFASRAEKPGADCPDPGERGGAALPFEICGCAFSPPCSP